MGRSQKQSEKLLESAPPQQAEVLPARERRGMEQLRSSMSEVDQYSRSPVEHDHGFLEKWEHQLTSTDTGASLEWARTGEIDPTLSREPGFGDKLSKAWWRTKLVGAEWLRGDLAEGTERYRHFLDGTGEQLDFDYGEYMANDPTGTWQDNATHQVMQEMAMSANKAPNAGCAPTDLKLQSQFSPHLYPETENWQKALGGHNLTTHGTARVFLSPEGEMVSSQANYLAEDMYNFNPGNEDIASHTPDSENGRFEQTGQAREFLQIGRHTSEQTKRIGSLLPPSSNTD